MKILLLSAYDAASHRRWRQVLVESFIEHDWTVLYLPARYFSWRVRGNSLSWAFQQRDVLTQHYDLMVVTSMVDLSALRGFVPKLSLCPTLVYFHENQFAYPNSGKQFSSVEPQMLNLYTALVAEKIVFNSHFNRNTFFQGAQRLLRKLPDHVPQGLLNKLHKSSDVVPVPLGLDCFKSSILNSNSPLTVVWNHRWEYDKAPERLFAAIKLVLEKGVDIRVCIIGPQFRHQPTIFTQMYDYLQSYYPISLSHWGFVKSTQEYQDILLESDVVLSTALHDFQGLAVLEAVAAACLPLVPNRLCYSQWFEQTYLYDSYIETPELEARELAQRLIQLASLKRDNRLPVAPDVSHLSINLLKSEYTRVFAETINQHSQQLAESVL